MPVKFSKSVVKIDRNTKKQTIEHDYMKSKPLKDLVDEQTPGGLNWQGVNELRKLGYYRLLEKSLKKIYKRL